MPTKRSFWKSLILSSFVAGTILSLSLLGRTEKAEAQITPVNPTSIPDLLTSFSGRWLEIDPSNFICYIYDFKPSGTPGLLRTVRFGYALNPVSGQCRFSTGAFAPSFGAVSGVAEGTSVLVVVYPSGFTEQIPIAGVISQGIVIQRNNQLRLWEISPR